MFYVYNVLLKKLLKLRFLFIITAIVTDMTSFVISFNIIRKSLRKPSFDNFFFIARRYKLYITRYFSLQFKSRKYISFIIRILLRIQNQKLLELFLLKIVSQFRLKLAVCFSRSANEHLFFKILFI